MQRQLWLSCFTARFFHDADAAVAEYVAGVLSDAAGDGSTAAEAASAVESFRAAGVTPAQFERELAVLLAVLRDSAGPQQPPPPSWGSVEAPVRSVAGDEGRAGGRSVNKASGQPSPLPSSALSAHAPAFQPAAMTRTQPAATVGAGGEGGAAAALPEALSGLALADPPAVASSVGAPQWGDGNGDGSSWGAGYAADGGGWGGGGAEAEAGWEDEEEEEGQGPQLDWPLGRDTASGWPAAVWVEEEPSASGRPLASLDRHHILSAGSAASAGLRQAFLSVLAQQFPEYSSDSLEGLLEQQGGSLEATAEVLCSLESELQGQAALAAYGSPSREDSGPAFGDADFPSLSAGAPASPPPQQKPGGEASYYAAAVRPAEGVSTARSPARPGPPPGRPGSAGGSRHQQAGASPPAKTPIWEAHGVPQFATGAHAAAQYAAAREEARDHARLRNAYFQQATQAFLAGNRALAKELGAKGRWHGQQMQAAHGAAAERIFAQRNRGVALSPAGAAAAGLRGSGSGSGWRQGGVATIDLHGLHVSEALERLESLLLNLSAGGSDSSSSSGQLRIVVGVGQHGKVPARLPAAVRRYLLEQGLQFSEPYAGLLEVSLH